MSLLIYTSQCVNGMVCCCVLVYRVGVVPGLRHAVLHSQPCHPLCFVQVCTANSPDVLETIWISTILM